MTLRKTYSTVRQLTTNLLIFALVFATNLGAQDRSERQTRGSSQRTGSSNRGPQNDPQEAGFVTYVDGDQTTCRDMTNDEIAELRGNPEQRPQLRVITPVERQEALRNTPLAAQAEGANGLTITLRSTTQLDGFPEAKAAFIRAAAQWEAIIKNPISIIIDVDYGPTRFGTTYPSGVLGSTSTPTAIQPYDTVRTRLLNSAASTAETTLYTALPTGSVSTDIGSLSSVSVASPLNRALGLAPADAASTDTAPSIGFNSNFTFDFDPSNGITAGQTDFDAVAVHEMGHALGFISNVGGSSTRLSVWDIFRFRPGTTMSAFTTAQRILTTGGEHRFYDGNPELACSTGGPSGTGGDSRQASHWKDDSYTGLTIGIMDPTIASGQRKTITNNDLQMLETIGYTLSGTVPPTCTFSLTPTNATVGTTGGTGSVTLNASASTCAWTATSNASWITLTGNTTGTGSGTVNYSVAANTGGSRSGTISIGGQTFTVNQTGCSFTLSFATTSFPASASTGSVTVTANGTNCPWTATVPTGTTWVTITSGATGVGNGTVNFALTANTGTASRSATLTIAGRAFTITQAAGATCSYTVNPFNTNFTSAGGSVTITVNTQAGCTWRATESNTWLSFSPSTTQTGTGTVVLTVNRRNSTNLRTATVTIAGQTFTIRQQG